MYFLAAEAVDDDGSAGVARTFLPWFPDPKAVTPVSVVWLWPVASPGARDAADVLIGGSSVTAFQPGGRRLPPSRPLVPVGRRMSVG